MVYFMEPFLIIFREFHLTVQNRVKVIVVLSRKGMGGIKDDFNKI